MDVTYALPWVWARETSDSCNQPKGLIPIEQKMLLDQFQFGMFQRRSITFFSEGYSMPMRFVTDRVHLFWDHESPASMKRVQIQQPQSDAKDQFLEEFLVVQ